MAIKKVSDLPEIDKTKTSKADILKNGLFEISAKDNGMFKSYSVTGQDLTLLMFRGLAQLVVQGMGLDNIVYTNTNQTITGQKTLSANTTFQDSTTTYQGGGSIQLKQPLNIQAASGGKLVFVNGQTNEVNNVLTSSTELVQIAKATSASDSRKHKSLATETTIYDFVDQYTKELSSQYLTTLSANINSSNTKLATTGKAVKDYVAAQGFWKAPSGFKPEDLDNLTTLLNSLISESPAYVYVDANKSDGNDGSTPDTAVKSLEQAIKLINKRKFVGTANAYIYIMSDITIDTSGMADGSKGSILNINHPDLVQTKGLYISGRALIDKSKSSSHDANNLNPCFRKISIDVRKCLTGNAAIHIYSRTTINNIIFDGTISEMLYDRPPTIQTELASGAYKYSYTYNLVDNDHIKKPYSVADAYNLSGNDLSNYYSDGSISSNTNYGKITTSYMIQIHKETVSFRECVFQNCVHGINGANFDINTTSIGTLSATNYKRHDNNDRYLAANVFKHCANAINGSNGGTTALYGRIVFDKCYHAVNGINQGYVNCSTGSSGSGQFVFRTSDIPFIIQSGALLQINTNNPSNTTLTKQCTSINDLTSYTSSPPPSLFSVSKCTVAADGNATYQFIDMEELNGTIPLSSKQSYFTRIVYTTGGGVQTLNGYVNGGFFVANTPNESNKLSALFNCFVSNGSNVYSLPESGDQRVIP